MASSVTTHRRDRLSEAELESFESELRKEGYRLADKANESELLPGEYLKRKRSTYVYAYASPVVWELVWSDPTGAPTRPRDKTEARRPRR